MARPFFTRDRVSGFELFARHSDNAISKLLVQLSEPSNPAVGFQDLVARFTLDTGTEFLFVQGEMKVIEAYVEPILKEKLEEKRLGVEKEDQGADTLLDHLVQYTNEKSVIKDKIVNILVAGRDTTAATLTFAAYLLATHPEIMAKLRAEMFEEMKYLRGVVKETLRSVAPMLAMRGGVYACTDRLFPAVPLNERTVLKSTALKSGGRSIYISAGTNWSAISRHRCKDLWGPDADQFDPARWIDERLKKYVTPNPFIFLPFNTGPRICLGQQFAYK
ncbi:cytochrome P450 family protein [Ceratobasidium sp. AG-Ba]|nr:cytochrome P450 family protein [Ceratobasidium sp. AG-Ba]